MQKQVLGRVRWLQTSKRGIGFMFLKDLEGRGDQPIYDPREPPKLFTEVFDPKTDSLEAQLENIDKVAFPRYHKHQ
jgi:hypothetical protein